MDLVQESGWEYKNISFWAIYMEPSNEGFTYFLVRESNSNEI